MQHLSQLPRPLSVAERTGLISGSLGMVPKTLSRLPGDWPPAWTRFLDPTSNHGHPASLSRPSPSSASRPHAPNGRPPLAA